MIPPTSAGLPGSLARSVLVVGLALGEEDRSPLWLLTSAETPRSASVKLSFISLYFSSYLYIVFFASSFFSAFYLTFHVISSCIANLLHMFSAEKKKNYGY